MSRETANAARYAKGLCVLSELEGELLEALENLLERTVILDGPDDENIVLAKAVIQEAHGNP